MISPSPAQGGPPTAGPGGFSRPIGPISLRQYAGYEAGTGVGDGHVAGGIVTPCPGTGFGPLPAGPPLCGHWLATTTLSVDRSLPALGHCVQWRPPKTRFSHGAIGRLPFPVYAVCLAFRSRQPRCHPVPHALPNAGRSGGSCCHPPVPWASGSIGRNCAWKMTHLALVHPFAPLRLGRVQLQNHGFDSLPQAIGYFPYRWQSLALSHHPPPHAFPLS